MPTSATIEDASTLEDQTKEVKIPTTRVNLLQSTHISWVIANTSLHWI